MTLNIEPIKPAIGAVVHASREQILDKHNGQEFLDLMEKYRVLVFPKANLTDKEQLALTDKLGARVNYSKTVPGGDVDAGDVYTVTLDKEINDEPEYVLGTFFWHMDGVTVDMPPPLASLLSCRHKSAKGGQTEFANTYAAYEGLPESEKAELAGLRVVHTVPAAVREVIAEEELDPVRRSFRQEHPLVWTHKNGRKSLVIGASADSIVGFSQAESRALIIRLNEWAGQPAYSYRHDWNEGDLVVWDNTSSLHRVIPYPEDSGRNMHRTSVAGVEKVS